MLVIHQNLLGDCPGGPCHYFLQFSEVLLVLLLADGFIFLVTLIPPLFTWKNKKPDSRKRIFFAAFACLTFYFWLAVLALHSLYCFGFLAHGGPCNSSRPAPPALSPAPTTNISAPAAITAPEDVTEEGVEQCTSNTENSLKNITIVNFLIILILIIVIAANVNEGKKLALDYNFTLV